MSPTTAIVLVLVFVSVVWAALSMAPTEDEMQPLIQQVEQQR